MKKNIFCIFFIILILSQSIFSENDNSQSYENKNDNTEKGELEFSDLPVGFRKILLGMEFEEAKTALKEDSIFGYRGERDISILAGKNRSLIETAGSSNIKRSWLQFYDSKLYILTIQIDTDKIDYYSVYTALIKKYGEPLSIDPKKAIWKNDSVSMIVERPLVIKYIDLTVFNELLEKSQTDKAYSDILREDFINEF